MDSTQLSLYLGFLVLVETLLSFLAALHPSALRSPCPLSLFPCDAGRVGPPPLPPWLRAGAREGGVGTVIDPQARGNSKLNSDGERFCVSFSADLETSVAPFTGFRDNLTLDSSIQATLDRRRRLTAGDTVWGCRLFGF